ncbi:MAG: cation:proton antiporter [Pseudomonadales bacterium]|nr:cation:proton antiporter [Pseudomonadales bacterium]MCP5329558.1 cation:proton antiporter [Pseudomonadales bacterium]MCP5343903.1 cation:proton antiporter [Pseudomonadales bacterium]
MTDTLLIISIFLLAGVLAVPVASHFKLGSVLGYLIAGIVIGPALSLLNVDVLSIQHIAEFGVVMMLFIVGLELEPRMLWQMRMRLLGLGGLQVVLSTGAVMLAAVALGQSWRIALAVGLIFSLSSTAIVLQSFNEQGLMKTDGGKAGFSVLLFQDIAVIPMLALLPLLAISALGEAPDAAALEHEAGLSLVDGLPGWQSALITLGAIAAVILGGSRLTTPLFRFIASARLRELFTASALLIVVSIALLMSLVGLSPALGTFLGGVVLANSEYRHELESDIEPFKGLLLGLFFITVGAGINFDLLFASFGLTLSLTLGLMLIKILVLLAVGYFFQLRGADLWLIALGLAQAGEFGFVLLSFTVGIHVIPAGLSEQLLLIVALSMLLTPLLFIVYERLIVPRYAGVNEREADTIQEKCKVIIAGHGRVGGIANRMLRGAGFETTVIDFSASNLEMLRTFGFKVYYGDATRPDLLHAAGIDEADMLIIAIDGKEQITALTRYVVQTHPHVHIVARAIDRHHVYDLWAAGCRDIVRETFDSSLRLGRSALIAMGMTLEEAMQLSHDFETVDRRFMREVADLYDPSIPPHKNPAYVAKIVELNGTWARQLKQVPEESPPDALTEEEQDAINAMQDTQPGSG